MIYRACEAAHHSFMKKRVLIITYYWPPSGGAGVQRVLKTVKYLREFGWEPIVFTAEDAAYPVIDESLLAEVAPDLEVLRGPIWEPYELYKKFTNKKKGERVYSGFMTDDEKPSLTQRASVWIRGNFFIPDARKFWIRPSIKYLSSWLKDNPVDAILSSGPPHSTHLIARQLKRSFGIPWLADFRDPWTKIDFYDQLMLTRWADAIHHRQEQSVLKEADRLVTVSWSCADGFKSLGRADTDVITNGFDEADFPTANITPEANFSLCHIGSLNRDRNNLPLWTAFAELAEELPAFRKQFRLRFIGKTEALAFSQLDRLGLTPNVEHIEYLPHSEVTASLGQAHVLLLLTNDTPTAQGIVPGKTYEYLAARRPIMAIGPPTGDAARVLRLTQAGTICDFQDKDRMKEVVRKLFLDYSNGTTTYLGKDSAIRQFTRRGAAQQFAEILDEMVLAEPVTTLKK